MKNIFLTGVTGFVGKVVLEELMRQKETLGFDIIHVLIRPGRKGASPEERFRSEVVASPCFSRLPAEWIKSIRVIGGELTHDKCGLSSADQKELSENVTHIINCAASVEFDLPVREAAECNIKSSLNVLEFAKSCRKLQNMVNVSTAYVTPHRMTNGPVVEKLAPLPRPAREIYQDILEKRKTASEILEETGHPNTYTLTKCLSEHLLIDNKGEVPLTIVRPSIVSACWKYPFPSWIDSRAAFAGFVALIGSGHLRAVVAQYGTYLDVVPCDIVADRIIRASCEIPSSQTKIIHATCGQKKSSRIDLCISVIEDFFSRHWVDRYPHLIYVGSRSLRFRLRHFWHHQLPCFVLTKIYTLKRDERKKKIIQRLIEALNYLNQGFPYFTHNTFDFHSSMPLNQNEFEPRAYVETVCRGVYRHLMKRHESEMLLGGREFRIGEKDLGWTVRQPKGNWVIRLFAYGVRKGLRKCTNKVTFDRPSFEQARKKISDDNLLVLVPTHRSYLDFVLCSYLFFAHSDLGISIPHIAAAKEFSKIPVLGWLFRMTHAFYVKRGLGRENAELTKQVHELVSQRHTLEFFIEGTRSRSRQLLKPRRGMLKSLQSTGQKFTILPIAITYDRVPEEAAFMRELRGGPKPKMRLRVLSGWLWRLFRNKIYIGPIHINCGNPLMLDAATDVTALSRQVIQQLQMKLATTTHHLRCFLWHNPVEGVDVEWLKQAILKRGGQVLESPLTDEEAVDPEVEKSMRYQWMHWFYKEAASLYPNHPVIHHHIATNSYMDLQEYTFEPELDDLRLRRLIHALFEPICRDYWTAVEYLSPAKFISPVISPRDIVRQKNSAHLPTLEAAYDHLVQHQILLPVESENQYVWGPKAGELENYKERIAWKRG